MNKAEYKAFFAQYWVGDPDQYAVAMRVWDEHEELRQKRAGDPRLDDPNYTLGRDGKFYPRKRKS